MASSKTNKLKFLSWLLLIFSLLLSCNHQPQNIEQLKNEAGQKFNVEGDSSIRHGNYEYSIKLYDSIKNSIKDITIWDKWYYYSAVCWMSRELGKYDQCIKKADTCLELFNSIGLNETTAHFYANLYTEKALANFKLLKTEEAYKNLFAAKQVINQLKDSCQKTYHLDNSAFILYGQKDFEQSKNLFLEELYYLENCNKNNPSKAYGQKQNTLDNIGLCYYNLKKNDSARFYYTKAIEIAEADKRLAEKIDKGILETYNERMGVILGNLAKTYVETNIDTAINLYEKAINFNKDDFREIGDAQICMFQVAELYLQKKDYNQVATTLQKLRQSLDTSQNLKAELGYRKVLYEYASQTNQYQTAFTTYKKYLQLKDSLDNTQLSVTTTNLNKELKDREQQLQIQLLQKDKNISNLYLWIIAGALALASVIAILVFRSYKKSKQQNTQLVQLNTEITEQQKKTEDALQQVAASNRDKDRILRVVAHDLRNPLSGIAAVSKTILETDEEMQSKKLVEMIEKTSNHSLQLINELLQTHTQIDLQLELEKTNLNDIITNVYTLLQHKAQEKQQSLILHMPDNKTIASIDLAKMERVFSNLITNAIKFTHVGGIINITVDNKLTFALITIQDNGIGIANADQKNIFEMFGQSRKKGTAGEKSFGMGLSICKQIVDAHKGKIWVESEEGKGACFYVALPILS